MRKPKMNFDYYNDEKKFKKKCPVHEHHDIMEAYESKVKNTRLFRYHALKVTTPSAAPQPQADEEMRVGSHWFPSLPFQQVQVLFDSALARLCIFPSRYLYAIGLPPVFSLGWNLPPNWSCNPKQLDSLVNSRA